MKSLKLSFTILFVFFLAFAQAQIRYTIEADYYQKYNGCQDCDGFGAGNSDFEICMRIQDGSTLGIANYDEECYERGGENCPWLEGTNNNSAFRSINSSDYNTCLSAFQWQWRGFEDDGVGTDANTGWRTVTSNPTGLAEGVFSNWVTVQACSSCGGGSPCYRIKYRFKWDNLSSKDPAPDFCSSPEFMGTVGKGQTANANNFSNDCAGVSGNDPSCFTQTKNSTVWFTFSTPNSSLVAPQYEITVFQDNGEGDELSPEFALLSGSCGAYSCVTSTDGDNTIDPLSGNASARYDCLNPNTTYTIMIDGDDCLTCNAYGDFDVRVQGFNYNKSADFLCSPTVISNALPNGTISLNNQSNRCASISGGEPNVTSGDRSVWFRFSTGSTVGDNIEVFVDGQVDIDAEVGVYTLCGSSCAYGNLNQIDFNDGNITSNNADINFQPYPNTTYYVQVTGDNGGGDRYGEFDIDVRMSGLTPPNDNLCGAYEWIGTLDPNDVFSAPSAYRSNSGATVEKFCSINEQNWGAGEHTIWFKFTTGSNPTALTVDATASGLTQGASTFLYEEINPPSCSGSGFSNQSTNWMGTTYLQEVGSRGVDVSNVDLDCPKAETTYYIQLNMNSVSIPQTGTFSSVQVSMDPPAPPNDKPCDAITIASQPEDTYNTSDFSGTNVNATNCFEPDAGWTLSSNNATVWYKLNAPGRNLIIDANRNSSNNIDIKLALYEGPCGDASVMDPNYIDRDYDPTLTGCLDGLCDEDMYFSCLDPTKDYYLAVDGAQSLLNLDEGNFDISVYYPYEGGRTTCASGLYPARQIGTVPNGGSVSYLNTSNLCGLSAAELTTSGGGSAPIPAPPFTVDKAVWYIFRPPSSGSVRINANSDPVIGPALGFGSGDEINLEMVVYESQDGSCAPAAWTVTDYTSYSNGTLSYNEELIVNCLDPAKDYWLLVDGEFDATLLGGGTEGYFEIIIEDYGLTTTNDLACDAIPFTTNPTVLNNWNTCNTNITVTLNDQNNYCANNLNEPSPSNWTPLPATAKPVWYSFVAPPSGKLEIRLNTTTSLPWRQDYFNGKLAVYDLPDGQNICSYSFTAQDEVESDYDLDIPPASTGEDMEVECLVPGRTYYLMVDGKETALFPEWFRGEFSLEFESDPRDAPAPNDSICQAKPLGDPTGGTVGTNVNDPSLLNSPLRNPNDPAYCMRAENSFCATDADSPPLNGFTLWGYDNTVWYTFTGPVSGAVRIDVFGNIGLDGDDFAPQVVVYESSDGTCNGTMYDLKATPTISSGFGRTASMDVNCLNTGQTYFLAVDGGPYLPELGDINGYFEVEVSEIVPTEFAPSHDSICNAKFINPFASLVSISNDTNRCAGREFNIPEPSTFTRDHTVWYTFTTPSVLPSYAVEIDITSQIPWPFGDAVDPQVAVYRSSDNTCTGTIIEQFSDYSVTGLPLVENAEVHCLDPGTTYWIMVDGSAINSQGFFDITIESITPNPVAPNNNLCSYEDLGVLGETPGDFLGGNGTDYNNFCSDVESGEANPAAFGLDQTVWFSFVTPDITSGANALNVNLEVFNDPNNLGDLIDLQIAIYQSDNELCTGNFYEIESAYNPIGFGESINNLCLKEDTRYFVQVDGGINVQGYFTIRITNDGLSSRPINDDFCNAQELALGVPTGGNNECATLEINEPNAGGGAQNTVWYSFVAPSSGRVEIRTEDNDGALFGIDPEWRLYDYFGSCTGGAFIDSFSQLDNAYFPTVVVTNPDDVSDYECLFPGRTYYIQVDGTTVGGPEGDFVITVTDLEPDYGTLAGPPNATDPEPENNICDNAINLTVQSESCQFSSGVWDSENYGKPTKSVPEVNCGQNCGETWYKFNMPATGFAKIEGNDDLGLLGVNNSELVIVAYRGACAELGLIECGRGGFSEDVDFSISGSSGETIYLQVFDDGGEAVNEIFEICVSERCAADDCLDALSSPNILDQGPQCFDVNDATGENIAGGDEGYGVGGVYGDNPTNSVYFAFETDDFCAGYTLNLITTDVGNIGGFGGAELIMTVYEDDGSPCSHNPSSEPFLDIQTFDRSTYPSGVNYSITYTVGTAPNDIKPNKRYIIQIEGNATTVDGTIEISKICSGREWAYPNAPLTTSDGYCFDGSWRHYYNDNETPGDPTDDILIFSVRPNGNVFDGVASITLDATPGFAETPGIEASWSMRRYWNFELSSGSIVNPVDVKFYYEASEKHEIISLAQAYAATHSLTYEPFEWFKSADSTAFNPNIHVTPPIIIAAYGSGSGPSITGDVIIQSTGVGSTVVCRDHDADPSNEFCNGIQYVEYIGLPGFSGGTGAVGVGPGGSPLPVELLHFRGEHIEEGNLLEWATATEINNDYFEVQRSVDGIVFDRIAQIEGAGNSSNYHAYEFLDISYENTLNYYRLKNVDFDNSYEYSSIIVIDNSKAEPTESMILLLYPNPSAQRIINLDAFIARSGEFKLEIYDLVGKQVSSELIYLDKGKQTIAIDFEGMSTGSYVVEMIELSTNQRVKKKFVRTN